MRPSPLDGAAMSSITYRPELDGLRAVAVIPVILFHMGLGWMPGGYIGVDVFFVISGFLITRIILAEVDRGTFRLRVFWARRVRRILPALVSMVLLTSVAGSLIFYGPDINALGKQGVAALLSFANMFFWQLSGDYWGPQAESSPLLHTWSLSVEEQFYLIFPLSLMFIMRVFKRGLVPLVVVLVAGSLSLFLYGCLHHPTGTFYLLPTRAWELGSGCVLAILIHLNRLPLNASSKLDGSPMLPMFGLLLVVSSFFLLSGADGISAYLALPVAGAVLLIAPWTQPNFAHQLLSLRPLVFVGKISYSLYLWHWPMLHFAKNLYVDGVLWLKPWQTTPFILALSVVSYYGVEQPLRRKENSTLPILAALALALTFSFLLSRVDRVEDVSMYHETVWEGELYDVSPHRASAESVKQRMQGITIPVRAQVGEAFANGGIIKKYGGDLPEVVLLGDSHALMWAGTLDEVVSENGLTTSFYAADGTPAFVRIPIERSPGSPSFSADDRFTFQQQKLHYLKVWKPKVVVIVVRWSALDDEQICDDLMTFLHEIGSQVLLIEQPPELF
ncbi:MAG: peptidoglycan/LPS O-acetylase OafA/YrhL, partial [Verrucomicrobiales bacterium]